MDEKNRFNLKCKVSVKRVTFLDKQSRGKEWNQEAEVVLLVPEQSTECDFFFDTYLPEKFSEEELKLLGKTEPDRTEVPMLIGHPVRGFVRGALSCSDSLFDRPYIFVMTKYAEDRLKLEDGKRIDVMVIPAGEEAQYADDEAPFRPELSERSHTPIA